MPNRDYSYATLAPEYQKLWDTMKIIQDARELQRLTDKINKHVDVYKEVEKSTGVPWQLIAVIHIREAGEQDIGVWKGALHNGEKIIGTNRKTKIVPANRGPFPTWKLAAEDAVRIKGFDKITAWPVSRMLWALEPYNGYGYRNKGIRSPYLWASTNHEQKGKYIRDHVFDPNVEDTQIGAAALLKYLGVGSVSTTTATTGVLAMATAYATASYQWTMDHPLIMSGVGIAALVSCYLLLRKKH